MIPAPSSGDDSAPWTLWAGTLGMGSSIADRVEAAIWTGCSRISVGMLDLQDAAGGPDLPEIRARLRDAGLEVVVDPVMNWYPSKGALETPFAAWSARETLRAAAELGAVGVSAIAQLRGHLGVARAPAATPAVPPELLTQRFAALCDMARDLGMRVALEFIPMTDIPDLATAWAIIRDGDRENGTIALDSWHFFRGVPDFSLLATVPANRIGCIQLNDAPAVVSGTLFEDVRRRLLPGEGSFDLVRLLRTLNASGALGSQGSIGPEVIHPELAALPAVEAAELACSRTRAVLDRALTS